MFGQYTESSARSRMPVTPWCAECRVSRTQICIKCSCSCISSRARAREALHEHKASTFSFCAREHVHEHARGSFHEHRNERLQFKVMLPSYEKVGINHVVKDKLYFDFILQHLACRLNSVIAKKNIQGYSSFFSIFRVLI